MYSQFDSELRMHISGASTACEAGNIGQTAMAIFQKWGVKSSPAVLVPRGEGRGAPEI